MAWSRRLLILSLPVAATALSAQPPAPRPWQVDWGQYYCSMIRQAGENRPYTTAFLSTPGDPDVQIMLAPQDSAALPGGISSVVLLPGNQAFAVTVAAERRGSRDVLMMSGLTAAFRDALAAAGELQFRAGDDVVSRVPLDNPQQAVTAHRRCMAELAREWGVDEAALASLRQYPVTTNAFGLTTDDYPSAALRTETQGRVIVRLDVGTNGRVSGCAPVATSGNAELDATTCRLVRQRARFRPAIDAGGRRVAARIVATVVWRIPGRA